MNINEKFALYEFCRSRWGKEYHNLSTRKKESLKKQFFNTNSVVQKHEILKEDRRSGLVVAFPDNMLSNLSFQGWYFNTFPSLTFSSQKIDIYKRPEKFERSLDYDALHYKFKFKFDMKNKTYWGENTITLLPLKDDFRESGWQFF